MNNWQQQTIWAKEEKKKYKKGDKLLLKSVNDSVYNKYEGEVVTVETIDDMGQLKCHTKQGQIVNICAFYGDIFKKIANKGIPCYIHWEIKNNYCAIFDKDGLITIVKIAKNMDDEMIENLVFKTLEKLGYDVEGYFCILND